MEAEFGVNFVHVDTHVSASDPFHTTECTDRSIRYGVSGIPHVMIDGEIAEIGADVCANQANTYRNDINQRFGEVDYLSPIKITGQMDIVGNQVTVTAHYEQVDPGNFTSGYQATLYVYEDDVEWCCGYGGAHTWDDMTRMVRTQPISLSGVGDVETYSETWDATTAVGVPANLANLHPVAIMELTGGSMAVVQATDFGPLPAYFPTLTVDRLVASVPNMNGTALFSGHISNLGTNADVLNLSIDNVFGWPADFQVQGDPAYYTSKAVAMAPNETRTITVRVQTDGVKRIGSGTLTETSQNGGQVKTATMKVFNGSYAILFVDDDSGTFEAPFTTGLTNLGYLYTSVSTANVSTMIGYDAIVWHTGYATGNTVNDTDQQNLMAYLDTGGKLFLSSMDGTNQFTNPSPFPNSYLGLASWTVNTKAHSATGVSGDPITTGMSMALTFPNETVNRVDTLTPIAGANTIFKNETGIPAAIRYQLPNQARTVFCTILQNAFPQSGADPNNSQYILRKVMEWLLQSNPAAVGDGGPLTAGTLRVSPTPFLSATQLQFALSNDAARGPVSLHVIDASGRQVRSLVDGALSAGSHAYGWDGLDDAGRATAAGLYFAVLKTANGESSAKLIRIR